MPPKLSDAEDDGSGRRFGNWRAMVLTGLMARVEARVIEWSTDGLIFHSDRAFPEGTRLKLVVALNDVADPSRVRPMTVPLRVTMHIVRGMAFRMTCRFEALNDDARVTVNCLLLQSKTGAL
ncbi:MAG: hypothetical protein CFE45_39555 [Burkholderiales bacterium PBB5]|nr:MAG: hypothetical protein CFE45_39555 [Burkholderiales bacterium PBB5]